MSSTAAAPSGPFLAALLEGDPVAAEGIVRAACRDGIPPHEIVTDVIAPAMRTVGELWMLGELSVAEEHMASEIVTGVVMRQLTPPPRRGGRRAIVLCAPQDTHVLGARALASVLTERLWDVTFLGAATPTAAVELLVAARRPHLVAYSVKQVAHLPDVADAIARLRAVPDAPAVLVGGRATSGLRWDLGADRVDDTLASAVAWLDSTFPPRRPRPVTAAFAASREL